MKVYLTLFSLFFSTLTLAHGVDANTQQFLANTQGGDFLFISLA